MPVVAAEPGTLCAKCPCHKAGILVDGVAVCDLCDDDNGRHYVVTLQTSEPIPPTPELEQEAAMPSGVRHHLSTQQLKAIQDAYPKETCEEIAKRLGLPKMKVYRELRKLQRGEPLGTGARRRRGPGKKQAARRETALALVPSHEQPQEQDAGTEVSASAGCVNVSLSLSSETLDAWWNRLALEQKADIFSTNLEYSLTNGSPDPGEGGDL